MVFSYVSVNLSHSKLGMKNCIFIKNKTKKNKRSQKTPTTNNLMKFYNFMGKCKAKLIYLPFRTKQHFFHNFSKNSLFMQIASFTLTLNIFIEVWHLLFYLQFHWHSGKQSGRDRHVCVIHVWNIHAYMYSYVFSLARS